MKLNFPCVYFFLYQIKKRLRMAFKREDGSWNVGLIMALVVAALAVLSGGFAIYYTLYSRRSYDSLSSDSAWYKAPTGGL